MYRTAFNPTDSPQPSSDNGKTIGGGEWGTVDTTDASVQASIDSGALLYVEVPDDLNDGVNRVPAATDVLVESARLEERRAEAGELSKEELVVIAIENGLLGKNDEAPNRAELEAQLIASDVSLSAPAKTATQSKAQSTASSAPESSRNAPAKEKP